MFLNIIIFYVCFLFCILVYYFVYSVFCFVLFIVSPFGAVSFLFLYKSTDDSHRVENQLQQINK
jgi:hypothetical protein